MSRLLALLPVLGLLATACGPSEAALPGTTGALRQAPPPRVQSIATPLPPPPTLAPRVVGATAVRPTPDAARNVFGPITFSAAIDESYSPLEPATVFPAGTTTIYGVFSGKRLPRGTRWTHRWFVNGVESHRGRELWQVFDGDQQRLAVRIQDPAGLPVGRYQLELLIDGVVVQRADAEVR